VKASSERHPLHVLFHPQSVAVIGASTNPQKVGHRICKQLLAEGFPGRLVPVNLKGEPVAGIASVKNLADCGHPVDLAVITTATETVPTAVADCARHGVKVAIVHTAGFGETGPAGMTMERELVRIARGAGMRLVGPNCMQIYSAASRLNLIGTPFVAGNVAMISQSGNLIRGVTEEFERVGLGFSHFVSVGNQADLGFHEYLDYLKDDPDSHAILLYVEGFLPDGGRRLIEAARQTVGRKPILLLKGGTSQSGSRSTLSHTGSLAGAHEVIRAAMRQAGVLMVERLDELVPIAEALTRLPLPKGRRIAVIGGGGGHATVCADAVERNGLEVPEFSAAAQEGMRALLPPRASTVNPVDFTGASEREIAVYAKIPEIALEDGMSAVLLYGLYAGYRTDLEYPGNTYVETSGLIVDLVRRLGKPAIMQTVYAGRPYPSLKVLRDGGVPVTESVEHAARCLAALCEYSEVKARVKPMPATQPGSPTLTQELRALAASRPQHNLTEPESLAILARHGIPVIPHAIARSPAEAVEQAQRIGYPVVLKALSPQLIHKSDRGGVRLNLPDAAAVGQAYREVCAASGAEEAVVASYRPDGTELIAGVFRDKAFGPVLMFGLGGILVEIFRDVTFRVLPIERSDAEAMLEEVQANKLLGPVRNRAPRHRGAIVDLLLGLGQVAWSNPELTEIDLNPVLSFEEGAFVADARMVCASGEPGNPA
jgi:acetyltransferase